MKIREPKASRVQSLAQEIASSLGPEGASGLAKALVSTLKPEDVRGLVEELTHALISTLKLSPDSTQDIRRLLNLLSVDQQSNKKTLMTVMSTSHYHALREALAHNTFQEVEGSPWPTATLSKGNALGHAELRPPHVDEKTFLSPQEQKDWSEMMWRQREALSDLDADVLDALSAIWLKMAKSPKEDAITDIDSLLAMRNLKPKRNSTGHGLGYHPQQRADILQALSHIQNLWLNMTELEVYTPAEPGRRAKRTKHLVQSRAFVITDRMGQLRFDGCIDVQQIVFRPGNVFGHYLFGPGRQTALLSAQALHYDPYHQDWEKRLTRYFCWQWKCQASTGCEASVYRAKTLLEATGCDPNIDKPARTRERLEKALETLLQDNIIAGWQYENWEEDSSRRRGWLEHWLQANILVQCPEAVKVHYKRLERSPKPMPLNLPAISVLAQRIINMRRARCLTQKEAAAELGVSQSYFSLLEREKVSSDQISPKLRQEIDVWLSSHS